MYSRILIATDGSELAGRGVEHGLALARTLGSSVTIISVSEPWVPMGNDATGYAITDFSLADDYERASKATAQHILDEALARAKAAGVPCTTVYVSRQYPADAILDYTAGNDIELVVMASHGRRGLGRLILGSQTSDVLTRSKVPVLVVR